MAIFLKRNGVLLREIDSMKDNLEVIYVPSMSNMAFTISGF
jgi:hypothetical protein